MEFRNAKKWTSMIRQPDFVTEGIIKKAIEEVEKKKNLPALSRIGFKFCMKVYQPR